MTIHENTLIQQSQILQTTSCAGDDSHASISSQQLPTMTSVVWRRPPMLSKSNLPEAFKTSRHGQIGQLRPLQTTSRLSQAGGFPQSQPGKHIRQSCMTQYTCKHEQRHSKVGAGSGLA